MSLFRFAVRSRLPLFAMAAMLVLLAWRGPAVAAEFQPLEIVTKSGVKTFSVEMAVTDKERETGLMYRKELADGRGMLFDFNPEQNISMWMKNTFISLDMIFIDGDGRIIGIQANTVPLSTSPLGVERPSRYVLEVPGGWAARRGVAAGDRVELRGIALP